MTVVTASTSKPSTARADVLVLGVRTDDDATDVADALTAVGFTGKEGQVATFPAGGFGKVKTVVALGLPTEPSAEKLRRAAAVGLRAAQQAGARSVALALHPAGVDEVAAIAEGVGLGAYRFDTYKTSKNDSDDEPDTVVDKVQVLTPFARQSTTSAAVERAGIVARAVNAARDWVNTAPGDLRPPAFADAIAALATKDLDVTVWDEKRLAKEGCGGLIGVGAGSDVPPRLVRLTYAPSKPVTHLALVGKGITFDSGGLSIKTGSGMQTMKMDMAGAAAVVAAVTAIAELGLPIAVTAWACLAENMPSGSATRPGDVLTLRGGRTVEVHNTDAEGRLVLGDGLALAAESPADRIVDVATLTGACVIALGERTTGLLGNDDDLRDAVLASAEAAGEPTWALPIPEEIGQAVTSSTIADVRQHNPKPYGGTSYAAAFLREFVGEKPWAHLDIAGPAWNDGSVRGYTSVGGTGTAVRTLVRLAEDLSAS
ncbi:leucyl aminopeptidase [Aeromicrobium sp. CTD01-1L150]|uniref:leucyl aminopeptidase n=1 Tax=Aeromicrobium sp. CTD01-1L150 TaxID=3341830 RepID=UPI0035BF2CBA